VATGKNSLPLRRVTQISHRYSHRHGDQAGYADQFQVPGYQARKIAGGVQYLDLLGKKESQSDLPQPHVQDKRGESPDGQAQDDPFSR